MSSPRYKLSSVSGYSDSFVRKDAKWSTSYAVLDTANCHRIVRTFWNNRPRERAEAFLAKMNAQ